MSLLGSLVGGVFGLFGNKKKKQETTKTETVSTVDYQKMVTDAQAAGFNPLTAIRNGGSAGFSTTTGTTTAPVTSSTSGALANIGGALGDALSNQIDPFARKQRQLDTALVDYQLRQLKEGPKATPGRLYPGGQFTGTKFAATRPSMASGNKSKSNPVGYDSSQAKLTIFGDQDYWQSGSSLPDASSYEDRYGEVLGSVLGVGNLVWDIGSNLSRWGLSFNQYLKSPGSPQTNDTYKKPSLRGGWTERRFHRPGEPRGGGW